MAGRKRAYRDLLEEALNECDVSFRQLEPADVAKLQRKWRLTFAHRVKEIAGVEVYLGFDWHAFSYDLVYALERDEARRAYAAERVSSFYALPNLAEGTGYRCEAKQFPNIRWVDTYITPIDFSWTMVFTHEEEMGVGPFFTRGEWSSRPTRGEDRRARRSARRSRPGSRK